jgi:hypothetical protein
MAVTTRRWLARVSFVLMLAAVVLVLAVAGWRSLGLVAVAAIGACAVLAGAYWFLAKRGPVRWLALVLVVAAPAGPRAEVAAADQVRPQPSGVPYDRAPFVKRLDVPAAAARVSGYGRLASSALWRQSVSWQV